MKQSRIGQKLVFIGLGIVNLSFLLASLYERRWPGVIFSAIGVAICWVGYKNVQRMDTLDAYREDLEEALRLHRERQAREKKQ